MVDSNPSDHLTPTAVVPAVILKAWQEYGDKRPLVKVADISATVSTNKVYRVLLGDGHEVIAKTTLYGSYVHFRQDHRIVQQWNRRLANGRYRNFLAQVCLKEDGEVFTAHVDNTWVVFYEKAPFYDFLPKVLSTNDVACFGREMGELHLASSQVAGLLSHSWKSLGSDVAILYDVIGNQKWREDHNLGPEAETILRRQCEKFLSNAERLGYHQFQKIPVLVDWNIGNFSIGLTGDGFRLFTRWDYDWFRVEPRMLDFYFCARVVREEGDQETFSYTVGPLFEERFRMFLRAYHQVFPLTENEILFLKEAYRVFLLNYVIRIGEHFFRPEIIRRLYQEALDVYFPVLDRTDFSPLLEILE
jgi:Ser/Thr protein kinase RdoA (MazF antagonist)